MEIMTILVYTAVCVALFALFRLPLNRVTVPSAAIGGLVLVFGLIQFMNFYHPYSNSSHHISAVSPSESTSPYLVAWFPANSLLRLNDGSAAEVTFDAIPGQVFWGQVQTVPNTSEGDTRIPVVITITDPEYVAYQSRMPDGYRAKTAIYGEDGYQLAVVRKTLLRMSAWMNYLTPVT